MALKLYQFPISHYCEKIRWAMDHKGLDYQVKNLLPGLHVRTTTKLAKKSYVPVLEHEGQVLQNSRLILNYLDKQFPEHSLTPRDPVLRAEAEEWESLCDVELGRTVRCFCYHTLLDHPDLVIPFFTKDNAWWSPYFFKMFFPKLEPKMRHWMKINEQTAQESEQRIVAALEKINDRLKDHDFLVGDQFSRADLSAAALLAPLFMPDGYGLDWPEQMPPRLQAFADRYADRLEFAKKLYREYR